MFFYLMYRKIYYFKPDRTTSLNVYNLTSVATAFTSITPHYFALDIILFLFEAFAGYIL